MSFAEPVETEEEAPDGGGKDDSGIDTSAVPCNPDAENTEQGKLDVNRVQYAVKTGFSRL